ncbi:PAS domain S-box protein [Halobellus marinus]|uniref:PAS domain S-box protein n=1 Tax=Halobellus TaxID=1073986 RepID=UPI0028A5F5D2|nr:PAS domain S-box protein [Halobellus sp. DFY28]
MTATGDPSEVDVLHVDDDPSVAELTATYLERKTDRITVRIASDAAEGRKLLAENDIDCVVSDYEMPGENGIEFLRAVRENHGDLPFILYTGRGSEEVASDAVSAGVTDYLQKGSGTEQYELLANRILNAVEAYRSRRKLSERTRRLETLIDTLPGMVYRCQNDPAWPMETVEGDVESLTGYPADALEQNEVRWGETILHPEDREPMWEAVQEALDSDRTFEITYRIITKTGDTKVMWERGRGIYEDGSLQALEGFITDITERKEREEQLERTTARLEALFENSPDMINIHDKDGTIVDVNGRFCEVFDQPPEELVGKKVWEIDRELDPEGIREMWQTMAPGDRFEVETEFGRADGERFPVEVHVTRLPENDGQPRFMVISRDITEAKEREANLRRYEQMVNAMREAACIYDEAGNYVVVNERLAEVYGTAPEALVGEPSAFLNTVRARADGDPFYELLDGDRDEVRGELESVFGAYGDAFVEYRLTPLVRDGRIDGVVSVTRDITERKQRERALEEARKEYEDLINGMEDSAWVIDTDDETFLQVNDAAVERTGYTRAELLSMRPHDIDAHLECEEISALIDDIVDDEIQVFETVHETKDGARIPVEISATLISYRGETAVLSIARDITDRKEREKRLEQFASVVSHDLRNPLNVAEGRLELACEECDTEHLAEVQRAHERMEDLIEDLLTLARDGDDDSHREWIELAPFAKRCWQSVATGDAQLRVVDNRTIRADPSRLRRLFENLLRNAVEHSSTSPRSDTHGDADEHDGAVTIVVGALDDGFYIEDTGPGIPERQRMDVFEMGYSTDTDGTGFGLNIVEQVVESHSWEIEITEASDGGARFEITGVEHEE